MSRTAMCISEANKLPYYQFINFCSEKCNYGKRSGGKNYPPIMHTDELKRIAQRQNICPYVAGMELATNRKIIVSDYNYIFSDISDGILNRMNKHLENS